MQFASVLAVRGGPHGQHIGDEGLAATHRCGNLANREPALAEWEDFFQEIGSRCFAMLALPLRGGGPLRLPFGNVIAPSAQNFDVPLNRRGRNPEFPRDGGRGPAL